MPNKEHLNEKIAQTERILKWIKALNDSDNHEELMNAIWFLQYFTQDIEHIYFGKNVDSGLLSWGEVDVREELRETIMRLHNIPLCESENTNQS